MFSMNECCHETAPISRSPSPVPVSVSASDRSTSRSACPSPSLQPEDFKDTIESLQKDNNELREIITQQDAKLERAIFAIYQLHGGLYNQKTQKYVMESNNAWLNGVTQPTRPDEPCNIWPTTRQGDEHEARILKMEKTIELLQDQILRIEAKFSE
jgi:hypothetical protein